MLSTVLKLNLLPESYGIFRLASDAAIPTWASGEVVSITRTSDELSIVCSQSAAPGNIRCEKDWRCLRVAGQLDFSMVGVIASLTAALASARISVFVISTYDTDYLFVKQCDLESAAKSLKTAGHDVSR